MSQKRFIIRLLDYDGLDYYVGKRFDSPVRVPRRYAKIMTEDSLNDVKILEFLSERKYEKIYGENWQDLNTRGGNW